MFKNVVSKDELFGVVMVAAFVWAALSFAVQQPTVSVADAGAVARLLPACGRGGRQVIRNWS